MNFYAGELVMFETDDGEVSYGTYVSRGCDGHGPGCDPPCHQVQEFSGEIVNWGDEAIRRGPNLNEKCNTVIFDPEEGAKER